MDCISKLKLHILIQEQQNGFPVQDKIKTIVDYAAA
jgi:hypothetical protein